jgi:hypothetical protein
MLQAPVCAAAFKFSSFLLKALARRVKRRVLNHGPDDLGSAG